MKASPEPYTAAMAQARLALKTGNRRAARRWAERAAAAAPDQEDPWLLLAALASPRASLEYLKRALAINPQSERARKGMHWAIRRYRAKAPPRPPLPASVILPPGAQQQARSVSWLMLTLAAALGALLWLGWPSFSATLNPAAPNRVSLAQAWGNKASPTPSPTATFTASPTLTPSLTPSPTITPSLTPSPTISASPTQTAPPPADEPQTALPPGVKKGEIWLDVDLTGQILRVYEGKNLVGEFIVSTGTWQTPTVTGQYRVYVKYPAADMAGPGYYLPSVPYVMYFYKGYGIHGTYWHNNFGTPMSHGCVNLKTQDAEWVYNMASIGTVVNIHY